MGYQISSEAELREVMGEPHELVRAKSAGVITQPFRRFIELSPFVCLGTHDHDGACDLSPRGDAPGFVHVQDEKTLVLPERPGNKRLDSVVNIIQQPRLSLLFMIPGVLETVRVNGSGIVSTDPELLNLFPVNGKLPQIVIVVTVEEVLGHCSKAYRRSRLWQPDYVPQTGVPTLVEMMAGHLKLDAATTDMLDHAIEEDAMNNLY